MTKREMLLIAGQLYAVLNEVEREDLTKYINAEYNYNIEPDWSFGDIINEFLNDIDLENWQSHVLSVITQFHSEDEKWYGDFLRITGFNDHIEFIQSVDPDTIPSDEDIAKANGEDIIYTHDGCSIAHALEVAKINSNVKVEMEFMCRGENTKFHVQAIEG